MRFDSRNSQCKSPFGAAVCGAEVSFRLLGREDYAAAQLVARFAFAGQDHTVPLSPDGDNFRRYTVRTGRGGTDLVLLPA